MQNISNYKKKYGEQDPRTTAQVKRLQDLETQMTSQKINDMSYDKMTSNDIQMTSNDTKMTSSHNIYREKEIEKEKCVLPRAKENDKNDTHTQNDIKFQKMTIEKLIEVDEFKKKLLSEGANNTIPRCFDNNNFEETIKTVETFLLYTSPIKTCFEKVKNKVEVLFNVLDKNTNTPFGWTSSEKTQNLEVIKNIARENQYCSVEILLKFVLKFRGKRKQNGFLNDAPMYSEFEKFIEDNKDIATNNNRIFRKIKDLLEDKKNNFSKQDTKPKVGIECYKVVKSDIECSGESVVCKCGV